MSALAFALVRLAPASLCLSDRLSALISLQAVLMAGNFSVSFPENIRVGHGPRGVGLFHTAAKGHEDDSALYEFRIPLSLTLTPEKARNSRLLRGLFDEPGEDDEPYDDHSMLTVFYLATLFGRESGDPEPDPAEEVLGLYLSSLPTSADWTWADPVWKGRLSGFLSGRRVASLTRAAVRDYHRLYRRACRLRPWLFELGDPSCSLDVFLAAKAMIGSRILSVGPRERLMAPLLDLVNHDPCGPNIWYESEDGHFELTAAACSQDTPGELLISYAEHMADPAVSLLSYGFDTGALQRVRDGRGLLEVRDRFHIPVLVEDDSCSPERHLLLSETSSPLIVLARHGQVTAATIQAWHVATAPCRTISDHLKALAPGTVLLQLDNPEASRINITHVMDALGQYAEVMEAIELSFPASEVQEREELRAPGLSWYPAALKIYERAFIGAQREESLRYLASLKTVYNKFFGVLTNHD